MPFTFENYGTFTGPNSINGDYDYDAVSEEEFWWRDLPTDTSFKLTDLAVVFLKDPFDYLGFYLYGTSTSLVTLAKNTGNIPVFIGNIDNSIFNGNIFVNGQTVVNGNIFANGIVNLAGVGNAAAFMQETRTIANSKKGFDIPHPTKENHRLRYICVEGPSAEVYIRGKLKDVSFIEIPEYWSNLVDKESIGVTLTPIGCYQELFVDRIESNKIYVRNNASGPIHCSYVIFGERIDGEKNIPEYQGLTPNDYPGDNTEYIINGV